MVLTVTTDLPRADVFWFVPHHDICWLSFGCERRNRREIFRVVFLLSKSRFFAPDQSSYRKLVHVFLQCWQSKQICNVQTLSFHICFRILCFQAAPAVLYFSFEFVEDLIVVEDHWADSTLALVPFHLFRVTQSSSALRLHCTWSADVPMWSILGHPRT